MDIKDLRLLIALAQYRHFARAAEACHVTQPALSIRIRNLEESLGRPIVIRGRNFSGFTEDGERILIWARRILADYDALWQELSEASENLTGHLRIGVIPSATPATSEIMDALSKQHPKVTVEIRSMSSRQIQVGLDELSLQAGITYLENEPLHHVQTLPLYDERYLLLGKSNLLKTIPNNPDWAEAANLPLCLLTEEMQNRRILDTAFSSAGKQPLPAIVSNSVVNLLSHVRQGGFASVLPEKLVSLIDRTGLESRSLSNPVISQKVGLAVPDRTPKLPVTRAVWDTAVRITGNFDKNF